MPGFRFLRRRAPKLPPLNRFSEPRIAPPPGIEAAFIAMFAAGFLAGASVAAFIARFIFLQTGAGS